MGDFFPDLLLKLLVISITFSVILMALIQKFKDLEFINKKWQVWFLNLFFSFIIGIPFAITFYDVEFIYGIWVSLFSFIGATAIYEGLKKQNLINYTPKSSSSAKILPIENEIKRDI